MVSSRAHLEFILEQLSELEDTTYRAMMGELIIYYRDKIAGGIYDDMIINVLPLETQSNNRCNATTAPRKGQLYGFTNIKVKTRTWGNDYN